MGIYHITLTVPSRQPLLGRLVTPQNDPSKARVERMATARPFDALFDACAAGRVLILSPWPYTVEKRKISREECVALNQMAEEICNQLERDRNYNR